MKLPNFLQTGVFRIVVVVSMLVQGFAALPTPVQAQAPTLPTKAEVAEVMQKVNDQWQLVHNESNTTPTEMGNNYWERAVYFIGNMAHYELTGDARYLKYAENWADAQPKSPPDNWGLYYPCDNPFADNQAAGQVYLALNEVLPDPTQRLSCITTSIQKGMTWASIEIDLDATYTITQTKFYPIGDRGYRYYVLARKNLTDTYQIIVDRVTKPMSGTEIVDVITPFAARQIKLWIVGAKGYIENQVGAKEFQLYGPGSSLNLATKSTKVTCFTHAKEAADACKAALDNSTATAWTTTVPPKFTEDRTSPNWWWIDALFMAMPIYAKMSVMYNDPTYSEVMYTRYADTRYERGLYSTTNHLWYRDESYISKQIQWSRGNGWVFAALAKVIEGAPNDAHINEYKQVFIEMAEALKKTQLTETLLLSTQATEGYWTANLTNPRQFPTPEASGTALFTYGLAWGINHTISNTTILDRATYEPIVAKGWNWLVNNAVHPDGELGYIQPVGADPQATNYGEYHDFGVGLFLLAGSEVYKLASDATAGNNLALRRPVICSEEPEAQNPCTNAVNGNPDDRWSAPTYPDWIEVDLGAVYQVSQVRVYAYQNPLRAYRFKIEAKRAKGDEYQVVVDRSGNRAKSNLYEGLFAPVAAQFIRLTVTDAVDYSGGWTSIREFEVFGKLPEANNLAFGRQVTCSSAPEAANPCTNLVNGNKADRWSGQGLLPSSAVRPSFEVDLGSDQTINGLRIYPRMNRAYLYEIEARTATGDVKLNLAAPTNLVGQAVFEHLFAPVTVRFVKVSFSGALGYTGDWVSIHEFEVFNQQVPEKNVALNRLVVCSEAKQLENACANVVDGNLNNRWSAEYPQSFTIDLGKVRRLSETRLYPYMNRAYRYEIRARRRFSDTLETIVNQNNNTTGGLFIAATPTPMPVDTRFVTVTITGAYNYHIGWTSISDFQIFEQREGRIIVVNPALTLLSANSVYQPQAVAYAPAGVFKLWALFRNQSDMTLDHLFLQTTDLTGGNLMLNADGGPAGMGAVLPALTPLQPGETYIAEFQIGLQARTKFHLAIDAYALPGEVNASGAESVGSFEFTIDESMLQVNPDDPGQANPIYLPLISR